MLSFEQFLSYSELNVAFILEINQLTSLNLFLKERSIRNIQTVLECMTHSLLHVLQANVEDYESQVILEFIATVLHKNAPALRYLDEVLNQYWVKRHACQLSHDQASLETWEEFKSVIISHSKIDIEKTQTVSEVDYSTAVASNKSSQLSLEKTNKETSRLKQNSEWFSCLRRNSNRTIN